MATATASTLKEMSMPSPRPADTKWDRVAPRPFKIAVPESSLDDLKARLARVRWPDEISGEPWQFGTDLAYLKSLCAYWKDQYDWRAQEAQINLFKQFKVSIGGCEHAGRRPFSGARVSGGAGDRYPRFFSESDALKHDPEKWNPVFRKDHADGGHKSQIKHGFGIYKFHQ
jgi:Epoxide hydrolase N terminus